MRVTGVTTMYLDSSTIIRNGKSYTRHLLRNSFRENGKVKHRTVANLSACSEDEIKAIKLALKHKKDLSALGTTKGVKTVQGKRLGAVWALTVIAQRLGITKAFGADRDGKLALLQVIARVVDHGSRLSAVRFAQSHAVCELIDLDELDEDDLCENLAWLHRHQEGIEKKLFKLRFPNSIPTLFLYDLTSSFPEEVCSELGEWGYNRDGKKGAMQIAVGMLAGPDGLPLAVRVFRGNTKDTETVSEQVRILAENFEVKEVTLVGDRGMLSRPQLDKIISDFSYITAITKTEILKLLEERVIQYELFTEHVCEVESNEVRYIIRRNPVRAEEMAMTRQTKRVPIEKLLMGCNEHLATHPRASVDAALKRLRTTIEKLECEKWFYASAGERALVLATDEYALEQVALLDGCYVIESNVSRRNAEAQTLHDRYCDLEILERAFATMKSPHLEMTPGFARKEHSTKGHVFVLMLALLVQRELERCWKELDMTVEEGIDELASIHMEDVHIGARCIQNVPEPNSTGKELLEKAGITLPSVLPSRRANVHTNRTAV